MEDIVFNLTEEEINADDLINVAGIVFKILNVVNPVYNIVIVEEEKIREINREYRNKDSVTDVISFAFEEKDNIVYNNFRLIGEIYICAKRAKEQADEYGHTFRREICYLTVHGLLHLLGYDHMTEEDKMAMRNLEEKVLEEYDCKR